MLLSWFWLPKDSICYCWLELFINSLAYPNYYCNWDVKKENVAFEIFSLSNSVVAPIKDTFFLTPLPATLEKEEKLDKPARGVETYDDVLLRATGLMMLPPLKFNGDTGLKEVE